MHLVRWRGEPECTVGFLPSAHRDRETHKDPAVPLMLTLWALAGRSFCFVRKEGFLYIGLFEAPHGKARRRRARR